MTRQTPRRTVNRPRARESTIYAIAALPQTESRFEILLLLDILRHPIPLMKIMTNYSLEFGVMLRAVCPARTGLLG